MSYRKKSIKSKIHRIKPKESIFKKLWFWIIVFCVILFFVIFYFVFFYSGFQLRNISISGNEKISTEDLKSLVLKGANTGLVDFLNTRITSKSIFLVNNNRISVDILKKYPEIEQAIISKNYPSDLSVKIKERKPIGVFCRNQDNTDCYMIDDKGIVFEPVYAVPDSLIIVRQESGSELIVGKQSISKDIMNTISKIKDLLENNFKINLKEAFVADSSHLNIKTAGGWYIYFDLSSNVNSQLLKLNLLMKEEESNNNTKNLRYINLIPRDRAVVCDNKECGSLQ